MSVKQVTESGAPVLLSTRLPSTMDCMSLVNRKKWWSWNLSCKYITRTTPKHKSSVATCKVGRPNSLSHQPKTSISWWGHEMPSWSASDFISKCQTDNCCCVCNCITSKHPQYISRTGISTTKNIFSLGHRSDQSYSNRPWKQICLSGTLKSVQCFSCGLNLINTEIWRAQSNSQSDLNKNMPSL